MRRELFRRIEAAGAAVNDIGDAEVEVAASEELLAVLRRFDVPGHAGEYTSLLSDIMLTSSVALRPATAGESAEGSTLTTGEGPSHTM